VGGVILKAIWTMRHASFTSGQVMNKFGLSLLDKKKYFLLPCHFLFAKLSLVSKTF